MFKRIRWFTLGYVAGFATFVYLRNKTQSLQQQYAAVRGTTTAINTLRSVRRDLREAWADGRAKLTEVEQRLRESQRSRSMS